MRNVPTARVTVTEGSLLIIKLDDVGQLEAKLTPSARFALGALLQQR